MRSPSKGQAVAPPTDTPDVCRSRPCPERKAGVRLSIRTVITEREGSEAASTIMGAAYNVVHRHMRQFDWYQTLYRTGKLDTSSLVETAAGELYYARIEGLDDAKVRAMKAIVELTKAARRAPNTGHLVIAANFQSENSDHGPNAEDWIVNLTPTPSAEDEYFEYITNEAPSRYRKLMTKLVDSCTPKQVDAIKAYATYGSYGKAAKALGVTRDSLISAVRAARSKFTQ